MLLKYILILILLNSTLTSIAAATVKKHRRSRKLNISHSREAKNKLLDKNQQSFTAKPPVPTPLTPDIVKRFTDFKTSNQDITSKMRLQKVMVKEIMEVQKVYEAGTTEIIVNPMDILNEDNPDQPAMKVVEYLFQTPKVLSTAEPSGDDSFSFFKPASISVIKPPKKYFYKKKHRYHSTRRPQMNLNSFEEFLKAVFEGRTPEQPKNVPSEHDHREPMVKNNNNRLEENARRYDDIRISVHSPVQKRPFPKLSFEYEKKSKDKSPPECEEEDDDDEDDGQGDKGKKVETIVEETNASVVETKYIDEEPDADYDDASRKKKDMPFNTTAVDVDSSTSLSAPMSGNVTSITESTSTGANRKTRACRKRRAEQEDDDDDSVTGNNGTEADETNFYID